MLVRFSVENFLSFNERVVFSMAAGRFTRMKDHVVDINNNKVLKGAYVFGANASGKSNLMKAIAFAKQAILQGSKDLDINRKHFRIKSENIEKPGVFQFDFIIGDKTYSYGFAISYMTKEFIAEWLYDQTNASEICLFEREIKNDHTITIHTDKKLFDANERERFAVYLDDFKNADNKAMKKSLILRDIAKRSSSSIPFFQELKEIFQWFCDILIIFPETKYAGLSRFVTNKKYKMIFQNMLEHFDTGIQKITHKEVPLEEILANITGLNQNVVEKIRADISNTLPEEESLIQFDKFTGEVKKMRNGDIKATKMVLDHGNSDDLFDCSDESDGTQRLLDLLPVLFMSKREKIIIIDEIDRSLHAKLTVEFIKLFYRLSKGIRTQLIVTTHESAILNLDLVRQDEIWFVERNEDHSSVLYSLNKFKARFDNKVEKNYILGRYGAIPVFSNQLDDNYFVKSKGGEPECLD